MLLTRNDFSSHMAFVYGFVSKHRLANKITNRKNVRNICAHLFINVNETTISYRHARFLSSNKRTIWLTTNSNQYSIVTYRFSRCLLAFKRDIQSVIFSFNVGHFSFKHRVEFVFDGFHVHFDNVFVSGRHQLI